MVEALKLLPGNRYLDASGRQVADLGREKNGCTPALRPDRGQPVTGERNRLAVMDQLEGDPTHAHYVDRTADRVHICDDGRESLYWRQNHLRQN